MQAEDVDRSSIAVAIVGRPNVGKSSLVNAITGALTPRVLCRAVRPAQHMQPG